MNKVLLVSVFKIGVGEKSTSRGNLKMRPMAAMFLVIFVPSIGVIFHAYCEVFAF